MLTPSSKHKLTISPPRQDPPHLDTLPYEILLEILAYIIPTRIPIRCKLFHAPMLGIPAGGLSIATVCKRIAAVVGELLFSRNWFEVSGGVAAAGFQKVSFSVSHIIISENLYLRSSFLFNIKLNILNSTTPTPATPPTPSSNTLAPVPRPHFAPSTTAWN